MRGVPFWSWQPPQSCRRVTARPLPLHIRLIVELAGIRRLRVVLARVVLARDEPAEDGRGVLARRAKELGLERADELGSLALARLPVWVAGR